MMMMHTTPKASTLLLVLTIAFNKSSRVPTTGFVDFGVTEASLKIRSKKGINMPKEMMENRIESRMKKQYQNTSPLYCAIYLKIREYRFM